MLVSVVSGSSICSESTAAPGGSTWPGVASTSITRPPNSLRMSPFCRSCTSLMAMFFAISPIWFRRPWKPPASRG